MLATTTAICQVSQALLKLSLRMTPVSNSEITANSSPMLVYDGSCGFCSLSVRFILNHERRHDLSFVTRNSELGKGLRRTHGLESVESMLWIEGGQAFAESAAVMKAAGYLGGWWSRLAVLSSFCPSFILNGVYKFIAKNRRRLSSKASVCLVPSPEQHNRFLA
jgi:predicted DCC family thiol-disulfide oxidoreductase YuxK